MSLHILFVTACAQVVFLQCECKRKRWHHSQTAGSTTCISQSSVATVLKWSGQKWPFASSFFLLLHAKNY